MSPEDFYGGEWTWARFTIVDRDGSQLTVELDPASYDRYYTWPEWRDGDVVIVGGTGRFTGWHGSGHVELHGSTERLEGDLVLTLDP